VAVTVITLFPLNLLRLIVALPLITAYSVTAAFLGTLHTEHRQGAAAVSAVLPAVSG
jgi:hypothetical protein